jgi:pimeloyl-ACP methyl ester carboxylesterase
MILATNIIGSGRPLVVLPTAGLDGNAMATVFEPIFLQEFDTVWQRIYVDLPGTGSSPAGKPFADSIIDSIQETINSVIADEPFALMGWSYGAYLGSGLIRRWPQRVLGLLSICGGVRIAMEHRDLTGLTPPQPEDDWLYDIDEQFHGSLQFALGRQNSHAAKAVAALMANNAPTDDEYFAALHAQGYALSDEEDTRPYDGPVSVVVGRSDRIAGFKDQFAMIDRYPNATYTAVPGAGHFVPVEATDDFANVMRRWLARL